MKNKIGLSINIDYEIREKNRVIKSKYNIPGHSFVKQFIQWLYYSTFYIEDYCIDTSNVSRQLSTVLNYTASGFLGPVSNSSYGVQVGTGTTAVTINDYKIETLIAHGTSTGQLQYSAGTITAPSVDATTTTLRLSRVFTNGSGATITVNEVALTSYFNTINGSNDYYGAYFLMCRDLVSPIEVTNGQQLTINYNLKTTI